MTRAESPNGESVMTGLSRAALLAAFAFAIGLSVYMYLPLRGSQHPVLSWAQPAAIFYGTALGGLQLNASANAAGTLVYAPPSGTVLNAGTGQVLTVVFTPVDTVNFSAATQTVVLNAWTAG